jgi:hypothetical protein
MISLFSSFLVLLIGQGKFKEALGEVKKYLAICVVRLILSELLNWPYSESPSLRLYASMLLECCDDMQDVGHRQERAAIEEDSW